MASRFLTVLNSGDAAPRCDSCIFFSARPRVHSNSQIYGECRKNPPSDGERFPGVEITDWCGEWHDGRTE